MDLLEPIVRYLTYDAYLRRDGYRVRNHRRELAVSQFKSADELAELQWMQLRELCHRGSCAIISSEQSESPEQ